MDTAFAGLKGSFKGSRIDERIIEMSSYRNENVGEHMRRVNYNRPWMATLMGGLLLIMGFPILASAEPAPVSQDTDMDGLRDLDEVSAIVEVPAGPSDESVYSYNFV